MGGVLTGKPVRAAGGPPAPMPWVTLTAVFVLGFGALLAGHFSMPVAGGPAAVIVPPWRPAGLAFADEVGLPPLDIRWGGRLVVFAPTDDPGALARMGPFVMPADGAIGCVWQISDLGRDA